MLLKSRKLSSLIVLLCTSATLLSAQIQAKTVRVGYYESGVFQKGTAPDVAKTGYAYEYYRKIAEYTGWKYDYVYGNYTDLYNKLKTNQIDLLAGVSIDTENIELFNFPETPLGSEYYYLLKQNGNSDITPDIISINGKKIGYSNNETETIIRNFIEENKIAAELIKLNDDDTLFKALNNNKVDVIITGGTLNNRVKNAEYFLPAGKKDFYIAVNLHRPDLLSELDFAQNQLKLDEPHFANSLYAKYYPNGITTESFSLLEKQWLKEHKEITFGYLNNYLPYCSKNKTGEVDGLIKELVPEMLKNLELENDISIKFVCFDNSNEMIKELGNGNIDVAFPVGGGLSYSEENGIYQTTSVIRSTVTLIYKDHFSGFEERTFAINKNNRMQENYVKTNFPTSRILYCDSIDDCLKAVKKGKADCVTVNGMRAPTILKNSKYSKLKSLSLPQNDERTFGIKMGNEGLLKIMNKGVNSINNHYILSLAYNYSEGLYKYSLHDFFRYNMIILTAIAILILAIVIHFITLDNKKKQLYLEKETKKNIELQEAREELEDQLEEIQNLNIELEHSQTSSEKYITDMIRYASSVDDPDKILNNILTYIGHNTKSDRAYLFEENEDSTYSNTYEWCREGVSKEKDNLQNVPYSDIGMWIEEFRKSNNIVISDLEDYKEVSVPIYNILKPQNIRTLVAVPIVIDGKTAGFLGVDNPPVTSIHTISTFLNLVEFIFSMMIRIRNNTYAIAESATHDQLTGCKNRKALVWAYEENYNKDKSMGVIACDMNGLKKVNDTQGHEAGDKFICRMADTLKDIFGKDNVYRMGGDEFTVVLTGKTKEEFNQLLKTCSLQVGTTASFGAVFREKADISFNDFLKESDMVMYAEKERFHKEMGITR